MENSFHLVLTDKEALLSVTNQQSSPISEVMRMVRYIVVHCWNCNILFKAYDIPDTNNILADCLSRFQVSQFFKDRSTCSKGTKPCARPAAATELMEYIVVLTQAALVPLRQIPTCVHGLLFKWRFLFYLVKLALTLSVSNILVSLIVAYLF